MIRVSITIVSFFLDKNVQHEAKIATQMCQRRADKAKRQLEVDFCFQVASWSKSNYPAMPPLLSLIDWVAFQLQS